MAQGFIGAEPLPSGRYVARARIMRGDKLAGVLVRPFILEPAPASKGGPIVVPAAFARVATFDRNAVLQPALVNGMLDSIAARSPSLKSAMVEARAGRYAPAALEALTVGDQQAAAFLKGLDLYAKGQIDQAATQLNIAAGPRREFYPAAFLLGACFAAGGKDRDAAGIWQMALGTEQRPLSRVHMLADARMRGGQPDAVVAVLKPAYAQRPTDDELAKRLAIAYMLTRRTARRCRSWTAISRVTRRCRRVVCRRACRNTRSPRRQARNCRTADRAKLLKYGKAYKGPQQPLLARVPLLRWV